MRLFYACFVLPGSEQETQVRALLQRVTRASVVIAGAEVAAIGPGLLVFVGVQRDDGEAQARRLAERTAAARVFADGNHAMNRSVLDVGGSVLVVSQFTLAADTRRGNRPSLSTAAAPEAALPLYQRYVRGLEERGIAVRTGEFGADMQVALVNDGPVTVLLEAPK